MHLSPTDEIIEAYKAHGTIDAVVEITGRSREEVVEVVDAIPNREHYRRRGSRTYSSPEKLILDLQRAARHMGEPLTIPKYRTAAKELGLASLNTILKAFPDDVSPWAAALKAAKVEGNPPRGRRKTSVTMEQCVDAVVKCWRELGERPSYDVYVEWCRDYPPMKDGGPPSGPTVRLKGWNQVVEAALAQLPESMLN